MAKRNASAAILDTLRDPRVVTMQPGAQTLWIRIVTAMQASGISVLKFGSEIMNQTGIALFIQSAETEIETHLKTILERGLLTRDADGAVSCPMLAQAVTRSEINKINGSKGGRPRKDGSPPAQRTMMLAIDGGANEETKITKPETKPETKGETPTTTYLLSESVSKVSKSSLSEFAAIGQEAFDAAGLDPARSMANFGIVRQWLADGADRELIIEVIRAKTHAKVTTLNYFTKAINDAIAARPKPKPDYERAWERDCQLWEIDGRGFRPMPNLNDYKERAVA